jgi:RNA polymerase sigma factor (TIGR02999 family)
MSDVTLILDALAKGDDKAIDRLLPVVYQELRLLAAQKLASERSDHTLQATALVHEAYLRLIGTSEQGFKNRKYFFGAAAEAMRRILIDNARRKQRLCHGGDHRRVDLDKADMPFDTGNSNDLLALDEALTRLAKLDATKAELIKLRFFSGLNIDQAAEILDISRTTAIRHWSFSRTWLLHEIKKNR